MIAIGLALAATNALAALIAYEPYNYTLGGGAGAATGTPTQTTGGGFFGPYSGGGDTIVNGLTYPGLLTANNALNETSSYSGQNVSSPVSSGTVYISFLIHPGTDSNGGNNGGNLVGLELNTAGDGMFVGVTAAASPGQGYYGVNRQAGYNDNGGNLWQSSAPNITYGTTNFIVVKLTGSGSGWMGSIWVNPTAGTSTEPAATGTFAVPQFTINACTIVNPGGGNSFGFDELRIADSWADAVSYTDPIALSVSITSPANGARVGTSFAINANASICPGTVAHVDFYVDNVVVGSDVTSPYTFAVTGQSAGTHPLKAVAWDSDGNSATSSVVNVTAVTANVILFPDGDFDRPAGDNATNYWKTSTSGEVSVFYPTTGGNLNGYAVMDNTVTGGWGVLVGGDTTPLALAPLGLVAGQTYTFVQDMKILAGSSIGGLKIESWGPNGLLNDSGNLYPTPIGGGSSWQTYSFTYTINGGATGIKVDPLWGPSSSVGYDNIGVLVLTTPLSVSISSPANDTTVNTNFTVTASAIVSPASVTNVYFYVDNALVGSDTSYPYTYTSGSAALSGVHTLKVTAKDSNGNSANSSVVNVTIVGTAPPIPNYPITAAPTPTRPVSRVVALLNSSGVYPSQPVTTWATPWSSPGSGMGANYTITNLARIVKAYPTLQYAGIEFPALNLVNYSAMHVDVWSPNALQFSVQLAGKNVSYKDLVSPAQLTNQTWVSLDFPLSYFPALNKSSVAEFLFVDNDPAIENATFYVDNVYFWTTNQLKASIALGNQVSWTNSSGNRYQPQKSVNNSTWINLGSVVVNSAVTHVYDGSPVPFYQVQEINPGALETIINGGFENGSPVPDNWSIAAGAPSSIGTDAHTGSSCLDLNVTTSASATFLEQGRLAITGGATYTFSAWSKLVQPGTDFSKFCLIQWFDAGGFLSQNQVNLTSSGAWTQNTASFTAPANATRTQIQVVANTGATPGASGEVYVDDVSLTTIGTPTTNAIPATVQSAVGITWVSGAGLTCQVQSSPSTGPSVWSPLGDNVLGSGNNTVSDVTTSSNKFYRVLEEY